MKKLLFTLTLIFSAVGYSQDLDLSNAFKADFNIDSITLGVESSTVNCSGAAIGYENGDYSAVYLTYHFTNRMDTTEASKFSVLLAKFNFPTANIIFPSLILSSVINSNS